MVIHTKNKRNKISVISMSFESYIYLYTFLVNKEQEMKLCIFHSGTKCLCHFCSTNVLSFLVKICDELVIFFLLMTRFEEFQTICFYRIAVSHYIFKDWIKLLLVNCLTTENFNKWLCRTEIHFSIAHCSGHSIHFQEGGDNPKLEGGNFSSLHQCLVIGPFPNEKYSKIMQNSQHFHFYPLILILNLSNLDWKR